MTTAEPAFQPVTVVASSTGRRVVFAAPNRSVVIRDLVSGKCSDVLDTTVDFGGRRLALSDTVDGVLAAAYLVHGVAFYAAETGREIWRRKDLKKVQRITLSRDGLTAYCGFDSSPLEALDLRTGNTTYSHRGTRWLHESSYDSVHFVDSTRPQIVDSKGNRRFWIERTTFAFLDVAFAPGLLLLSESTGPVRCLDVTSGHERWRYSSAPGSHVLQLAHREADHSIVGIEWEYERGGPKRLLRLSASDGTVLAESNVGNPRECCFALAGAVLVTTDRTVIPTDSREGDRKR